MDNLASWVATTATILAACMTASNLGSRITGYGFAIFTVGSVAWFAVGMLTHQPALVWTNVVMTGLNLFGIWRWLGRQAKVEEGAMQAARDSRQTPGESLFPVSLLTSTAVCGSDGELGTCVDAMAGSQSGNIAYVVVAQGGVGGVGETLRRLDWRACRFDGNSVLASVGNMEFQRLPTLRRDHWPDR